MARFVQPREKTNMATVTFSGNIGKYHGLKFSNDGKARASFSVGETDRIKGQDGQWTDGATTWFNVTLFGRAAEALDGAIPDGKGTVLVTGRMKTRAYEHNGEQRESLDVIADTVAIVPRSNNNGGGQSASRAPQWSNQPASDPWGPPQGQGNASQWGNGPSNEPAF
jgi:single-strand DNA-binding protein